VSTTTHRVRVTLKAETEVTLEVSVEDGDDPTDLTEGENRLAIESARPFPGWSVVKVTEVKP
jgi:hypothetical protein